MKKYIYVLVWYFILFWVQNTLANMWPASSSIGWGGIWVQDNYWINDFISIDKHYLVFQASDKDIYKENAPHTGYEFLEKLTGISSQSIKNDSFIFRDEYGYDINNLQNKDTLFINKYEKYASSGSVNIIAQYHLNNISDSYLKNQEVYFSLGKVEHVNGSIYESWADRGIENIQQIYVLNNQNDYPTNFRLYENGEKKHFTYDFELHSLRSLYIDIIQEIKLNSVDKRVKFSLSFEPNESKVITVMYSIPYKVDLNGEKYIDYDYSPIYGWKNGTVKKSTIWIIGNHQNIGYSLNAINSDHQWNNSAKKLSLQRKHTFTYVSTLTNLHQDDGIKNIKVYFANIDDINRYLREWLRVYQPQYLFESFFDKTQTLYDETNPPKVTLSKDNPEEIIIENNGKYFKEVFFEFMKHINL